MLFYQILLHVGVASAACAADPYRGSGGQKEAAQVQNAAGGSGGTGNSLSNSSSLPSTVTASVGYVQSSSASSSMAMSTASIAGSAEGRLDSGVNDLSGNVGQGQSAAQSLSSTTSTSPSSTPSLSSSSSSSDTSTGGSFTASFTQYGSNDADGSGNCNTASTACGFYNNPGYNAAVSQALFGVGPGGGAGPVCGLCYRLTPTTAAGANSIVVKVNNLCPDSGNPLCAVAGDTNFDLCKDDGAAAALFGSSGTQQVNGTAVQVDCGEWSGSSNLTS